jgi:hypothetical protein
MSLPHSQAHAKFCTFLQTLYVHMGVDQAKLQHSDLENTAQNMVRGLRTRTVLGLFQPSGDLPVIDSGRGIRMQPTYIHGSANRLVQLEPNTLQCMTQLTI